MSEPKAPPVVGPAVLQVACTVTGRLLVKVTLGALATLIVSPTSLSLTTGQGAGLSAVAADQYGNVLSNAAITWTTTVGTIMPSASGTTAAFSAGETAGSGTITVASGSQTDTVSVTVINSAQAANTQQNLNNLQGQTNTDLYLLIILGVLAVVFAAVAALMAVRYRSTKRKLDESGKGGPS